MELNYVYSPTVTINFQIKKIVHIKTSKAVQGKNNLTVKRYIAAI